MQKKEITYPVIDTKRQGKIELLMKLNNISVKQLQEYLGLACVQSIYRWFEGINLPSVDNLYAMSGLFHVPMDEMICGNRRMLGRKIRQEQYERIKMYYMKICEMHIA